MTPLEITITNDFKAEVIIERKQIEIIKGVFNNDKIIVEVSMTMPELESVLCLDAKKMFRTEVIFSGGVNYEYHYGEGDYHRSETFSNINNIVITNIPKGASVTITDENNVQVVGKVSYLKITEKNYSIHIEFNQILSGIIYLN